MNTATKTIEGQREPTLGIGGNPVGKPFPVSFANEEFMAQLLVAPNQNNEKWIRLVNKKKEILISYEEDVLAMLEEFQPSLLQTGKQQTRLQDLARKGYKFIGKPFYAVIQSELHKAQLLSYEWGGDEHQGLALEGEVSPLHICLDQKVFMPILGKFQSCFDPEAASRLAA